MRPLPCGVTLFLGKYETRQPPIERLRNLRQAINESQMRVAQAVSHTPKNTERALRECSTE